MGRWLSEHHHCQAGCSARAFSTASYGVWGIGPQVSTHRAWRGCEVISLESSSPLVHLLMEQPDPSSSYTYWSGVGVRNRAEQPFWCPENTSSHKPSGPPEGSRASAVLQVPGNPRNKRLRWQNEGPGVKVKWVSQGGETSCLWRRPWAVVWSGRELWGE